MKPTSPLEVELVFLRDMERRLTDLHTALRHGRNGIPEVCGVRSVLNVRIAEVVQQRDKENANAKVREQAKGNNSGSNT